MKDVESERPDALVIGAYLPRADVRDRLIGAASLEQISQGATVGTSSPRRTAQLLRLRPDLVERDRLLGPKVVEREGHDALGVGSFEG